MKAANQPGADGPPRRLFVAYSSIIQGGPPLTGGVRPAAQPRTPLNLISWLARPKSISMSNAGLVTSLSELGFKLLKYSEESRAFDNFYADFSNGKRSFRIVRDRSQLMLEGNKAESEPYGLWQLSIISPKSVPLLPKKYLIPRERKISK